MLVSVVPLMTLVLSRLPAGCLSIIKDHMLDSDRWLSGVSEKDGYWDKFRDEKLTRSKCELVRKTQTVTHILVLTSLHQRGSKKAVLDTACKENKFGPMLNADAERLEYAGDWRTAQGLVSSPGLDKVRTPSLWLSSSLPYGRC
ncbi:hypothetical protein NHX12_012117 [Muraenolepis orangiensis]|uniref:Uncharacterized protein n=1 Tax=Muraenolepis orangiensis TaxID=630683 RepID=A0A9Q0DH42_9TELE|nr:hypothetical protein NHX12_012117 [Muraenolepis orangiensis]